MSLAPRRIALQISLMVSGTWLPLAAQAVITINGPNAPAQVIGSGTDPDLTVSLGGGINSSQNAVELRAVPNSVPNDTIVNLGRIVSTGAGAVVTAGPQNDSGYYNLSSIPGSVIQGANDAIRLNTTLKDFGTINLDNGGTVRALNGQAVDFSSVIGANARTTINNQRFAQIRAEAGDALRTGSHLSMTNAGSITTGDVRSAADTFDAIKVGSATDVKITNYGQISGGRNGISGDQINGLSNYQGTIYGRNGAGVLIKGDGSLTNTVGTITGAADGRLANVDGDGVRIGGIAVIDNWGIIHGAGSRGVDQNGQAYTSEGVSIGGGYVINRNSPTQIWGDNNGLLASDGLGGSALGATTVQNDAVIRGMNGYGVRFIGEFDDLVINSGLITGSNGVALDMGGGNDTLRLGRGSVFEGLVDGGTGQNSMIMAGTSRYSIGSSDTAMLEGTLHDSRNFQTLQVQNGYWTIDGKTDFNQGVQVFSGALLKNQGSIVGDVVVDRGGEYLGNGSVGNLTINGQLSTSTSWGAPQVNGNLTLAKDATVYFETRADGSAATTHVTGNANLNGARLQLNSAYGYPWHTRFTVLEAGSITGAFESLSIRPYAYLIPTLSYEANKVNLDYRRNDIEFGWYARTGNGARAVESIESSKPNALYDALLGTSPQTAGVAIEALAGSSNANLAGATLAASAQVGTSMLSAMRQMSSGSSLLVGLDPAQTPALAATGVPGAAHNLNDPNARGRVWLQGIGSYGKLDGNQGGEGMQQHTQGSLLGVDWSLSPLWRMGILGGYTKTDLDSHDVDNKLHSWHVGAYAVRQDGPIALRLGAAYSHHAGDNKRTVAFESFNERPKGDYDADSQQAFAELGYALGSGRLNIEPFANLGYQRYHRDSYAEKGGASSLKVDAQTQDNISSTLGLRLAHLTQLDNGISLTPRASLGWRHLYGNVDNEARQAFLVGGNAFTVEGSALDQNSLMVEAGFDIGLSARHSVSVGYNGELGGSSRNHALIGQWQITF